MIFGKKRTGTSNGVFGKKGVRVPNRGMGRKGGLGGMRVGSTSRPGMSTRPVRTNFGKPKM